MSMPNESGLPEPLNVLSRTPAGAVTSGVTPSGAAFFAGGITTSTAPGGAGSAGTFQSLSGTGTAPIVAAGAGAGAGASIGSQKGHDLAGSFVITTAGTPAA